MCIFISGWESTTTAAVNELEGYSSRFYIAAEWGSADYWNKNAGLPVRLVAESTTLQDGETSTMTGNDGKIYRTVCIGGKEILADNLRRNTMANR